MRILVVTNMYPTAERIHSGIFVARQVEDLRRSGLDVQVELLGGERGSIDYLMARNRIARIARRFDPDVIHAHFGYTGLSVIGLGRPFLLSLCGDDLNGTSNGRGQITLKSRLGILVSQVAAARAARVIVVTESLRGKLWRSSRERAEVLPYGIDDEAFRPMLKEQSREKLGIDTRGLVVAFVYPGRQPTKRLDLAESACNELRRRGREVRLLVVDGVAPDKMPLYYNAADCLLMTSDYEGSPNCVKEALACGVPVVSVRVGDVPDLLSVASRGRVVDREPAAIASGIESLCTMTSKGPRTSMLPTQFSVGDVGRRLRSTYTTIAQLSALPTRE
jgi:glycosyltransferase involved in cell wall biosynthesis